LVYFELMKWAKVEQVTVSEYGIREGAILEMATGRMESCPL
jgi:exopolyphosphatase/pppGpp-phosphohydrolase